jgi:hypothetical protein
VEKNGASAWDEKKFNTIANHKYSKDRVVGSNADGQEEGGHFSFGPK